MHFVGLMHFVSVRGCKCVSVCIFGRTNICLSKRERAYRVVCRIRACPQYHQGYLGVCVCVCVSVSVFMGPVPPWGHRRGGNGGLVEEAREKEREKM
jgi:hypothetical protein